MRGILEAETHAMPADATYHDIEISKDSIADFSRRIMTPRGTISSV
jgi:hypothetical protein